MAQRFVPCGEEVKVKTENSRMRVCAIAREERGRKVGATESAHAPRPAPLSPSVRTKNDVSDRRSLTLRYHREGETKEESPFEDFQRLIGEHTEENQQ